MISPFSRPDLGGVESHINKLTNYLCNKRKLYVTLVTYMPLNSSQRAAAHEKIGSLEIIRMPWFGKGWFRKLERFFPLNMFYLFPGLFFRALLVYLRRHREFDVIHSHGFIAGAVAKVLTSIHKKRSVISTHAIYSLSPGSFKSQVFKWLLVGFDKILTVGEPSSQEIIRIGIPKEKVQVHPNWIEFIDPPPTRAIARRVFDLRENDFVVLFVGRMIGIKGELVLLEVARACEVDITFVFVGDGPESTKIAEAAKDHSKVLHLGKVADENMISLYAAADLFVSPVLYEEGFATVYLESLSVGTPVITARRGCLPFFLDDQVSELLSEVNPDVLLKTILKHFKNRSLLVEKRDLCEKYARKMFSENNASIILSSYS